MNAGGYVLLRDVLIQRLGRHRNTINIRPVERIGKFFGADVRMRQRRFDVVMNSIFTDLKFLEKNGKYKWVEVDIDAMN